MFRTFIRTSLRSLAKRKGFAFINVGGLALGIACFLLIGLYVRHELTYDRYHENADRIMRVSVHLFLDGTESNFATTAAPLATGLKERFPEVIEATRLNNSGIPVFRAENKAFSEERVFWADSTVFKVFTLPLIEGDATRALVQPQSVVLSESMAIKYFGTTDILGRVLNMDNRVDYTVTGVMRDMPEPSHFHADFLVSMSSRDDSRNTSWATQNNFTTYLLMDGRTTAEAFEAKLPAIVKERVWPEVEGLFGVSAETMFSNGTEFDYRVTPLTDIHLRSNLRAEFETNGSITYVWLFALIGMAILVIACINYINLSTAISAHKAKEVGIRKAVGSSRAQLIQQFLSDSMVLGTLASVIALVVVWLMLPQLSTFTGSAIRMEWMVIVPFAVGIGMVVGLVAGAYPAFYLSSFNPVAVLKGGAKLGKTRSGLRNGLIVFQYGVSAVLVLASLVVYSQLSFIQNTNLGFSGDQVIVIRKTDDIAANIDTFKDSIARQSSVLAVSNSATLFGEIQNDNMVRAIDQPETENKLVWMNNADDQFADVYELEMVAGRWYSDDQPGDDRAIVLNETAVALLGLTDPVGTELVTGFGGGNMNVVGVVKDFHVESLQNDIKPFAFIPFNGWAGRNTSVRVASGDFTNVLAAIEKEWYAISDGQAFEYTFFDKVFAERYLTERSMGQLLMVFSILAVLIAALGLFGLAAFVTTQRTKEIGIRKSLGASSSNIIVMLFRDFGKWILVANLIAWPVAWYVMNNWMQEFAYRTDIAWWYFPASLVGGLLLAFLVIGSKTFQAANANPVNALKSE